MPQACTAVQVAPAQESPCLVSVVVMAVVLAVDMVVDMAVVMAVVEVAEVAAIVSACQEEVMALISEPMRRPPCRT